ncbi:hypothetical protein HanRHA438_Chr04g0186171 [Helianthus annuus]|nr:hypothetical protein HanRHA438_Chr04g0186171 [Helianthus annuus]
MTGSDGSDGSSLSTEPKSQSLHPVYSVTNIQNKIRTLDGEKVTYSEWVKLFRLHARGYDVLPHIDGTAPPAETDKGFDLSHPDHVEHTERGGNVGECCNKINCFKSMAIELSFYKSNTNVYIV